MAYTPFATLPRPALSSGRPASPVVDRALVLIADAAAQVACTLETVEAGRRYRWVTTTQVRRFREMRAAGARLTTISRETGVPVATIAGHVADITAPAEGWAPIRRARKIDYAEARALRAQGWLYADIARHYGVSEGSAHRAVNGTLRQPSTPRRARYQRSYHRLKRIAHRIAAITGLGLADLRSQERAADRVKARALFAWAARTHGAVSFPMIGRFLGCDHTSVIYGVRKVAAVVRRCGVPMIGRMVADLRTLWRLSWPAARALGLT